MTSLVYSTGTVSVSNASAVVTGTGTAWVLALVTGGMFSFAGMSVPIASVESDTSLTLAYPWPGTTASGAYAIARETSEAVRAAWINDRMARLMTKPWGTGVVPDGRGTLAERDALNPMPTDKYCWLREETGFDPTLYFKTLTGWIGPYPLIGEQGPPGVGVGGYGLPAGGTTGQVPVKSSGVDGAVAWGAIDQASVDTASTLSTERGDAAYTILGTDRHVLLTAALTAPRVWTLPAVSAYKAGRRLVVRDAVGGVSSTNTLTVQRAGTDTIDGATTLVLDVPWEGAELVSNGVDAWSVLTVGAGNTKARRRRSLGLDDTTAAPNVGDAFKWNGTIWVPAKSREVLPANRTYHVAPTGSDTLNDGLSVGSPFLTIQKAENVARTIDFNGFAVTVQIADGTYTAGVNVGAKTGQADPSMYVIKGNTATPGNVIISPNGADCVLSNTPGAMCLVQDMEFRTATSGNSIRSENGSVVTFANTRFGTNVGIQLFSYVGGTIVATGNYAIVGGGSVHWFSAGGIINTIFRTVTITGTPAFTNFAMVQRNGVIECPLMTFSGSATGARYNAILGGGINTEGAGANYLPGNAAGTATSPGWYT